MKKPVLIFLLLLPFALSAQNAIPSLLSPSAKYCLMVPSGGRKVNIKIDFGNGFEKVKNEKGKERDFNSEADALNYMESMGWELVNVTKRLVYGVDMSTEVVCYLFKHKE